MAATVQGWFVFIHQNSSSVSAAVQQTAGASRRLFAPPRFSRALFRFSNPSSALFKSSLLDNTELFLNSNHHKHSETHTHIRTHAQGRLHLVLSASWRVAREGVLIRVSSDTVVTKPQQRHAFNVFFISAKLFEQRCLTTLNAGSKLLSEEPNEKWKHQQRLQQCSLGLWVPFLCLYQRKHAAILKSATNTTKFVPGAFYSRCCHSCSDIFAQHRSDNIQNGIYELRRERLNEVDQFQHRI